MSTHYFKKSGKKSKQKNCMTVPLIFHYFLPLQPSSLQKENLKLKVLCFQDSNVCIFHFIHIKQHKWYKNILKNN